MKPSPRIAWVGRECVACGCCEKACPRGAMTQGICTLKSGKEVKGNGGTGQKDRGAVEVPGQ